VTASGSWPLPALVLALLAGLVCVILGPDQAGDDLEGAVVADGGDAAGHREVLAPPHGPRHDGALDLVEAGLDAPGLRKQFLGPLVVVDAAEFVVAGL